MAQSSAKLEMDALLEPAFLAEFQEQAAGPSPIEEDLDHSTCLSWFQRRKTPAGRSTRIGIRVLDVSISVMALFLLLPAWILIALAIRLETKGPIVFRQRRTGLDGLGFPMFKFRSMVHEEERGPLKLTRRGDMRITRVGTFLRRYRLDETPQFINVLRGEMSVVGPRPEMPAMVDFAGRCIDGYHDRHKELPGITGLAQIINGYDGNLEGLMRTSALDRHYVRHLSITNYWGILLRTVPTVLLCRGAV